jgi:general secretion pathway protein M
MNDLRTRWSAMSGRERAITLGAAAVLLVAFLFLVAFEPAWQGRSRLVRELPQLREQAAQLEQLGQEAKRLKAEVQNAVPAAGLADAVNASLAQKGLEGKLASVGEGRVQVSFEGAHAGVLLTWIESVQRELRVRAASVVLNQTDKPGTVNAEVVFAAGRKQG